MRVVTRAALKRVGLILLLLGILVAWFWWSMVRMPMKSFRGALPVLTQEQVVISRELRGHVDELAGRIGERNVFKPQALNQSVDYIHTILTNQGHHVRRQRYTVRGEECVNLEVEIAGKTRPGEIVVVGAHYDSVFGSPGANDNASGVAALLILARLTVGQEYARTLRFVAFANEEPPFFQTNDMGSLVYAKHCRERGENIVAMLSLETMGYFRDEKGTQKYPFPLGLFYPARGDFLAFVGSRSNAELVRQSVKTFREQVPFPSEGAALPGFLPGINWSDHWSFNQAGYSAIMVTDTAIFRYPQYHAFEDLPEKLDYDRLARVVDGLRPVLQHLAN